jgi:hypothetical protein
MKKLSMLVACLLMIFAGSSCSKQLEEIANKLRVVTDTSASAEDYVYEDSAVRMNTDTEYTNRYLGFSYIIPKGWWLYNVNDINFAVDSSLTESPNTLDISYGEDAGFEYSFIDLVSFANLQDSRGDNHIGIDISAEMLNGVDSIGDYMEYYEDYLLSPDENTYELLESGQMEINGLLYEMRSVKVVREEDNYIYLSLTREVSNNYYLTFLANYWPDNRNAITSIINSLSEGMR